MPFHQAGPIRYFSFENLAIPGVKQAMFTRHGGVSPQPWDSLNFGSSVGDSQVNVDENLQQALSTLEIKRGSVYDVHQVHSNHVVEVTAGRNGRTPIPADAIITKQAGVTLLMRFADCVPILLVDPVSMSIGIAHAGWQGTVKNVAGAAVNKMCECFNTRPEDVLAGIGPSICQDHYQVGAEVIRAVEDQFGDRAQEHLEQRRDGMYFDLWSANRALLEQAGVGSIEVSGVCTAGLQQDWFSHRASGGKTGRFAALITFTE